MNFDEKTVKEQYVYKGKILNLRVDDVLLPDGNAAKREIIEHSGGACILCEKDDKILLVKQFRYPYKKVVYELPAGKINKGEQPYDTAKRELEEECGVVAESLEKIFEVYPSPGYTEEVIYIYKAHGVTDGKVHLDKDEFLSGEWFDKQTLKKMIENGKINDAKTLIALLGSVFNNGYEKKE